MNPYVELYAMQVVEEKRTIESIPSVLRENVREIVENAISTKKQD